jgi:hypothetical protein
MRGQVRTLATNVSADTLIAPCKAQSRAISDVNQSHEIPINLSGNFFAQRCAWIHRNGCCARHNNDGLQQSFGLPECGLCLIACGRKVAPKVSQVNDANDGHGPDSDGFNYLPVNLHVSVLPNGRRVAASNGAASPAAPVMISVS